MWNTSKKRQCAKTKLKFSPSLYYRQYLAGEILWTTWCCVDYQHSPGIFPVCLLEGEPETPRVLGYFSKENTWEYQTDARNIWRNQCLIFPPQARCTLTVNLERKSLHHLHLRRLWKSRGVSVANSSHLDKTACPLHVTLMDSFRSLPFSSDKAPEIHIVRNFLKIHWGYKYIFYFF